MARSKRETDRVLKRLRRFGLGYPETHFKSPWPGHMDLAVRDKTFVYLSPEGEPLGISCKLPQSKKQALALSYTKPTAYGLGKSGWVSASFEGVDEVPVEMLERWIDESYRAQAPKTLVKQLDAGGQASGKKPQKSSAKKKSAKKKAGSRRAR